MRTTPPFRSKHFLVILLASSTLAGSTLQAAHNDAHYHVQSERETLLSEMDFLGFFIEEVKEQVRTMRAAQLQWTHWNVQLSNSEMRRADRVDLQQVRVSLERSWQRIQAKQSEFVSSLDELNMTEEQADDSSVSPLVNGIQSFALAGEWYQTQLAAIDKRLELSNFIDSADFYYNDLANRFHFTSQEEHNRFTLLQKELTALQGQIDKVSKSIRRLASKSTAFMSRNGS